MGPGESGIERLKWLLFRQSGPAWELRGYWPGFLDQYQVIGHIVSWQLVFFQDASFTAQCLESFCRVGYFLSGVLPTP